MIKRDHNNSKFGLQQEPSIKLFLSQYKQLKMCTVEKRGNLFILTLTGEDEHRLNPTLISTLQSSLIQIKSQATRGSVLITTSQGKFFCNGFDLAWAQSAGSKSAVLDRMHHVTGIFKPVVAELISFPMPTIAVLPGHAAAAGFFLAICHDYVLMRRDRGVLYMSEVDIGLTLPDYFAALMRSKISSASARRDVLLKGAKLKGEVAVRMGIVDSVHDGEKGVIEAAIEMAEQFGNRKWDGEAYADVRRSLYPETCAIVGVPEKSRPHSNI